MVYARACGVGDSERDAKNKTTIVPDIMSNRYPTHGRRQRYRLNRYRAVGCTWKIHILTDRRASVIDGYARYMGGVNRTRFPVSIALYLYSLYGCPTWYG